MKIYRCVSFEMSAGHTNAPGGPNAAHGSRVWDPWLRPWQILSSDKAATIKSLQNKCGQRNK
jgi:hypothetical protein